jgi:hypothetical protein
VVLAASRRLPWLTLTSALDVCFTVTLALPTSPLVENFTPSFVTDIITAAQSTQ